MSNHYLITGGCGFIGSHIAETLVERGDKITLFDNLSSGRPENIQSFAERVRFIQGDICDYKALLEATRGVTHIFHKAALVSVFLSVEKPEASQEINSTGTLNVLRAAAANRVKRVVMASSSAIYGNNPALPKTEKMTPEPASPYAAAKINGEHLMRIYAELYGVQTVSLRYFNVYGPRQDPSSPYSGVISIFTKALLQNQPVTIFGDGAQTRDFVYVKDVVRANLLAMETEEVRLGEAFNIATGSATSLNELLGILAELKGIEVTPLFEPARAGDVRHSVADISLARRFLNFTPEFSLKDGLAALMKS
ncbi:MAG: SDR family oxidoreductase [Kiritimatiellae bacterium]|nr:SDR family oxidoreductase [Kiritimatiellia bacterium]